MNVVALAERHGGLRRFVRWTVPGVYFAALIFFWSRDGMPVARDTLVLWILLGLLAFSLTDLRRWARGVVFQWMPFLVTLWLYDLLRGQADGLLFQPRIYLQIHPAESLFARFEP